VLGSFDVDRALDVVRRLADDIGPRPAGTDADAAARAEVAAAWRDAGWVVTEEEVALPQGGSTANVVATLPGTDRAAPHVVLGAHLDTVAGSPGANDNATGVGVLVALADELADEADRLDPPVVLVAFAAEEFQPSEPREHHLGSAAYAAAHAPAVTRMVSVDMVGHGTPTCLCWLGDDALARELADVAEAAGIAGFRPASVGDVSDHGPFVAAGVPAVLLWTHRDGVYHTPADTSDRLHPEDLARTGELLLAWLRG
jgi:aminopeptidase YwaD